MIDRNYKYPTEWQCKNILGYRSDFYYFFHIIAFIIMNKQVAYISIIRNIQKDTKKFNGMAWHVEKTHVYINS